MVTLDKYTNSKEIYGNLFILKSEKFGIGLYLAIECNAKGLEDKHKFVKLPRCSVYDWSSMKNDEVLDSYDSIKSYDFAMKRCLMFKTDNQ